jgi:hypothetical protein
MKRVRRQKRPKRTQMLRENKNSKKPKKNWNRISRTLIRGEICSSKRRSSLNSWKRRILTS